MTKSPDDCLDNIDKNSNNSSPTSVPFQPDHHLALHPDTTHGQDSLPSLHLRIKSIGHGDTTARVSLDDTVASVKRTILARLGVEEAKYVRLIHQGRLLAPDTAVMRDVAAWNNDDTIHAVLAPASAQGGAQAVLARQAAATHTMSRRALRRVGILTPNGRARASGTTESDNDDDSSSTDVEEGRERLGFDRLRQTGLRRSEVTAIRVYFSRHVDEWIRQHAEAAHDEEPDAMRRRYLQEDAWMQAQGPASEFRLNLAGTIWPTSALLMRNNTAEMRSGAISATVGTDRDFMWGFMLGFFVGFLMLVWVWMPTVPHKQKLGILCGISFQLTVSLFKGPIDDDDILGD
jgi:hypothetical protein